MEAIRNRLLELFRRRSLMIGDFTLVSGMKSRYYFDGKKTTLDPEGAYLSAKLILEELKKRSIDAQAIGGLTLGADPIVSAVAAVSFAERRLYQPLGAFIVRKEPKKHGTQLYIEGFSGAEGARVVIIDDVCTTGESAQKAIVRAEAAGFQVAAVLALVDRRQGASEKLKDYLFIPLLSAAEILDDPEIQRQLTQTGE